MRAPAIADAEIHRLAAPEQLGILLLISSREFGDRTGITAKREEAPFLRTVICQWNAGIVLDDRGAVGEKEVANRGEITGVQQIGRALDQAVAGPQRFAKLKEAAALDAAIGKIGGEIIQRLFHAIAAREYDPDTPRGVLAGIVARHSPLVVERDQ